jgi:GNAT superfamily N-acetyltransferase
MTVQRAIFPESNHPGLSMVVDRYSSQEVGPNIQTFAGAFMNTGHQAWGDSDWMAGLAQENGRGERELARRVFVEPQQRLERLEDIMDSLTGFGPTTYWSANSYANGESPDLHRNATRTAHLALRREVAGSALGRLVKADTAIIEKIQVVPEKQRQGLATALAYTALGDYKPWARTRITIPVVNEAARSWAQQHGFRQVGLETRQFDPELRVPLDVVRLEGRVGRVRAAMRKANPWLAQAGTETKDDLWALRRASVNLVTPTGPGHNEGR